jgi:hypothetical protein
LYGAKKERNIKFVTFLVTCISALDKTSWGYKPADMFQYICLLVPGLVFLLEAVALRISTPAEGCYP